MDTGCTGRVPHEAETIFLHSLISPHRKVGKVRKVRKHSKSHDLVSAGRVSSAGWTYS